MSANNICWDCGATIPIARIQFLLESGCRANQLTCLKHSNTTRIKGVYTGENGTSDIILCDKVYNDSVRSKFREVEETLDDLGDAVDG